MARCATPDVGHPIYAVLGHERNRKSFLNINNMVLQAIPMEDNCDFHHKTGEIWRPSVKCPDLPGTSKSYRRNNFSFEQLDVCWGNLKY
jgi:hypothetical protein